MRAGTLLITLSEWGLIGVMGLCGSTALTHSNTFGWLQGRIFAHYPIIIPYLPVIIWGLIFVLGVCLVILAGSSGKFTWIVVLLALPSLFSFNSINVLEIVGADIAAATSLTFAQVLALSIAIVVCYVLLNSIGIFKQTRQRLKKRGAGAEDITNEAKNSHLWLCLLTAGAVLVVAVMAGLAAGLNLLIMPHLADMPWSYILAGLICIIILAVYLYWLGLRRHSG
jgi:hypothetical protein